MQIETRAESPAGPGAPNRLFSLNGLLDYFIPAGIKADPVQHRRARMFMLSHMFGPFLGNTIPLYLHFVGHIAADYRFWVFLISIVIFWLYPFVLRITRRYRLIAFVSVQNLIFCILWACYSYGGILSPFLPWVIIIPVLSFLYLETTGRTRNILLIQIFGSFGLFAAYVYFQLPLPAADLRQFQLIGLVSTVSASIYVTMMALYFANFYFANVLREQSAFERELGTLDMQADNLRNLTQSANQASAAKADFVASMSHELRTPLNAVIGYSQLLLEDAEEEGDSQVAADVAHIHGAGAHLLRLVDDVLDFSKIEAGKMAAHASADEIGKRLGGTLSELRAALAQNDYTIVCEMPAFNHVMRLDWQMLGKAVSHLITGVATDPLGGHIAVGVAVRERHLEIRVTDPHVRGPSAAAGSLFDIFSDESDTSATKYGGTGISMALALKFAQLLGGRIAVATRPDGRRLFIMRIPLAYLPENAAQPLTMS